MRTHTNDFKTEIKNAGRQIDALISYESTDGYYVLTTESSDILQTEALEDLVTEKGPIDVDRESLNSVRPYFATSLLKTVMQTVEIDSNTSIPKGTKINVKFGLLVNGSYEYIDFGNYYIVTDPIYNADTRSYTITAYDKMVFTMIDYDTNQLQVEYPLTVKEYIEKICFWLDLDCNITTFPNDGTNINSDLYYGLGLTYRDILDDLSEVVAGNIMFNISEELIIKSPTDVSDTINEDYIKDVNVAVWKKYGPINQVTLSRAESGDEIYNNNESSITTNGLTEFKIKDNMILDSEDRSDYLSDIFNQLDGTEFYLYDIALIGVGYYEPLDQFNLSIEGTSYPVVNFNDEFIITQGLEENMYIEEPNETTTDYSTSAKTDKSIKNAVIIANKNAGQIVLKVNDDDELVLVELKADANNGSSFNVKADNINFESYTFDLTTDDLTIESDNFSVTSAGLITANGANITGTITSTSGTIGGFTLASTSLTATNVGIGTGTYAFWAGSNTPSSAVFRVTNAGSLVATSATITGSITATSGSFTGSIYSSSGTIGGFTLSSTSLSGSTTKGTMTIRRGTSASVDLPGNGGRLQISSSTSLSSDNATCSLSTSQRLAISDSYSNIGTGDSNASIGLRAFNGNLRMASSYDVQLVASGEIYGAGNGLTQALVLTTAGSASSRSVKENIKKFTNKDYDDSISLLRNIDIYSYDYKYKLYKDKHQYGFIIDEVEKFDNNRFFKFEERIAYDVGDGELDYKKKNKKKVKFKNYDSNTLDKYILTVCKQLLNKIDSLEEEIEILKERNDK